MGLKARESGGGPDRQLDRHCTRELAALESADLLRRLHVVDSPQGPILAVGGRRFVNFSSNDYLGLAAHPALAEAAREAVGRFGAGSGASRLVCGNLAPHAGLEEDIARMKGAEACLVFSSGFAAALGAIPALVGRDDTIILDKLCHASLVDAARLSGARLRVFRHNDVGQLESHLQWAEGRGGKILVLVESVYSMDGDIAPLDAIVDVKDRHGAWLLVDEAHATGVFGPEGAGLCREFGVTGRVEVQMGTLSKALGSSGGFIAGCRPLIDLLVNRARSFIYSTGPAIAASAAARAAIALATGPEGEARRQALWNNVKAVASSLAGTWPDPPQGVSPILPLIAGSEDRALALAASLRRGGFWVPAIRWPTVPRGKARLRVSLSAAHVPDQITALLEALRSVAP